MERNTILVIDDDELNRAVLSSVFEDEYDIIEAENGQAGLDKLMEQHENICIVLLDMVMPVMNGLEFLRGMQKTGLLKEIPVFIITSGTSTADIAEAYELGVSDVIAKPVVPFVVLKRVKMTIELYESRRALSSEVEQQKEKLLDQKNTIINLSFGMIEALCVAIEFRSNETGYHIRNIRSITEYMLQHTVLGEGLSEEDIRLAAMASMMHDIGKISTPDAILHKPGKLTPEEFEIMKMHTSTGAKVLDEIPQLKNNAIYKYAHDIALHHHERFDGRGYPDGLRGDEISVFAQVVSIADVYDALLSRRAYKSSFTREKAVGMIKNGECGVFGDRLLNCFLECEPALYSTIYDKEDL